MFTRSTANAAHNTSNSNALRNAEEEFGSLKRHLERREAQRRGGNGYVMASSDVSDSTAQPAATAGGASSAETAALANVLSSTSRPPLESVPLFSEGSATVEVVQVAHRKHNRAILVHNAQWEAAHVKMRAVVEENVAAHHELGEVIGAAMEAQNSDPPSIESGTCTSNYIVIREKIRSIANAGSHIDSSDASPNDFTFLFSDATLTAREKVMLQRMRDLAAKLKGMTAAHAAVKDAAAEDQASYEGKLHDLREQQREAMADARQEWSDHRAVLEGDVSHWKASAATLRDSLDATRQQMERERDTAAAELATTKVQHKDEVAKWMQTVAAGDRDMHKLREAAREMEQRLSGSVNVVDQLEEQLRATSAALVTMTSSKDALVREHHQLASQLSVATADLVSLRAAKPEVADVEVQVDTNSIIADLRDSLSSARAELSRLRLNNDHFLKLNGTLEKDLRAAVGYKSMWENTDADLQSTSKALKAVSKRQHADHKRRMELVCENYCLRSMIVVLQRPNGFGERMENLQTENRWLMDRLQRTTPLRIMTNGSTRVAIDGHTVEDAEQLRALVQRHDGDEHATYERDVVVHVAHAATQTADLNGTRPTQPLLQPLLWKSASTYCTDAMIQSDLMHVEGIRKSVHLTQYLQGSDTRRQLEQATSTSRHIQKASQRFRHLMAMDDAEHDAADDLDINDDPSEEVSPLSDRSPPNGGIASILSSATQRPPRPHSAQSAGEASGTSSATKQHPSVSRHVVHAASNVPLHEHAVREATSSPLTQSPQLCVFGIKDAPQKSALSGNPTQYFSMKRSLGLSGAAGKHRELEHQLHSALEKMVVVETQESQARGVSPLPSTLPLRTLGDVRPTSATADRPPSLGASSVRPRSALVARSTSPMSSFMPAQRSAVGSWKPRTK